MEEQNDPLYISQQRHFIAKDRIVFARQETSTVRRKKKSCYLLRRVFHALPPVSAVSFGSWQQECRLLAEPPVTFSLPSSLSLPLPLSPSLSRLVKTFLSVPRLFQPSFRSLSLPLALVFTLCPLHFYRFYSPPPPPLSLSLSPPTLMLFFSALWCSSYTWQYQTNFLPLHTHAPLPPSHPHPHPEHPALRLRCPLLSHPSLKSSERVRAVATPVSFYPPREKNRGMY